MRISESDWSIFLGHLVAALDHFNVPSAERDEVLAFIDGTKGEIDAQSDGFTAALP